MRCLFCNAEFDTLNGLLLHNHRIEPTADQQFASFYKHREFQSNGQWRGTEYKRAYGTLDVTTNVEATLDETKSYMLRMLEAHGDHVRFNVTLEIEFIKFKPADDGDDDDMQLHRAYFTSHSKILLHFNDFESF